AGTLVAAVLGSAVFANPVLSRAILMTDWLFLLYLLAAIWFPAESLSRRLAGEPQQGSAAATEDDEPSSFQTALSLLSRRSCPFLVIVTMGFFLVVVCGWFVFFAFIKGPEGKSKEDKMGYW